MSELVSVRQRDRQLVAEFRGGDVGAFETLVRHHRRRLFVIALRRVGSVEVAEDAVQVGLSKAYRHLATMEDTQDVGAWLATVVENSALDLIRAEVRHRRLADRAGAVAPERDDRRGSGPAPRHPALLRLERRELGELLREGIEQLPERYRRALSLYHLQDLPVEEVAAVLSLNVNTVKSHLARGRGLLRRKLSGRLRHGGYL